MASPTYNTANWRRRRGFGANHRQWGIAFGSGAMLGGNTPQYLGSGQPEPESRGSLFGDGSPVYLTAPTTTAMTAPSTTTSNATAPQPATTAVVVPRT